MKLNILPEALYQILQGRDFVNEHVDIIIRRAGRVVFTKGKNERKSNRIMAAQDKTMSRVRIAEIVTLQSVMENHTSSGKLI